ncbi:MAG: GNAT family N-acetyltransferase [Elusimicrobiota bacterium]
MVLRELADNDEAAFLQAVQEYEGILDWLTFQWKPGIPFSEHVERLRKNARGEDLPPGRVPDTMLYAFVDGVIVGRVNIRHELNEHLRERGGHIGYSVAPRYRRRGYAAEMFRLCLPICRAVGLTRILITCDDDNVGSWKLLENAGARLEARRTDAQTGMFYRRYWLDV